MKVLEKNDMIQTCTCIYTQNVFITNAYVYILHSCGYNNPKLSSLTWPWLSVNKMTDHCGLDEMPWEGNVLLIQIFWEVLVITLFHKTEKKKLENIYFRLKEEHNKQGLLLKDNLGEQRSYLNLSICLQCFRK